MASSKAGLHQKAAGELLIVDDLTTNDFAIVGAAEDNLGGKELDATTSGLPAIGGLTNIGTAEDESADWLLIYDNNAATWKKVLCREFPQSPNYDALTESTLATGDHFHVWDTDVGYNKRITAEDLGQYVRKPLFAVKSSDQSSSSTSLTFITDLTQTLSSSVKYTFEACILFTTSGGAKFDIDGGTATFNDIQLHWMQTLTTGTGTNLDVPNNNYTNETTVVTCGTQNATGVVLVHGAVDISSGGSLGMRFARNAGFNSITVYRGSWIRFVPQLG